MQIAIIGASARAAACSALDAGFEVAAADLFADSDLAARCPATKIERWPHGFANWLARQLIDGWLYVGGLENHPDLVDQLATLRPLWGNHGNVLREVRSVTKLEQFLSSAGCYFPEIVADGQPGTTSHWLEKSTASCGGIGVSEWIGDSSGGDLTYFQRRVEGKSISGAYLAANRRCALLGVTEQLIGREWTRARPFQYAGSIGPIELARETRAMVSRVGELLADRFRLVGLFGVDFVVDSAGVAWAVDVNPRYTASMEIVERMIGKNLLAAHVAACVEDVLPDAVIPRASSSFGKAYLFAREDASVGVLNPYGLADIPVPGTRIGKHSPIATVLAECDRTEEIELVLARKASQLEKNVFQIHSDEA